eukprot:GHVR01023928.1.p1 GENE.GHVR01023928.1~~GHVR01023928.1.p1  ORF type:complete len:359 (+),score=137.14 GHVR01023928.1:370-1446(+)
MRRERSTQLLSPQLPFSDGKNLMEEMNTGDGFCLEGLNDTQRIEFESDIADLTTSLNEVERQRDTLKKELDDIQHKHTNTIASLEAALREKERGITRVEEAERKMDVMREQLGVYESDMRTLKTTLTEYKEKIDILEKTIKNTHTHAHVDSPRASLRADAVESTGVKGVTACVCHLKKCVCGSQKEHTHHSLHTHVHTHTSGEASRRSFQLCSRKIITAKPRGGRTHTHTPAMKRQDLCSFIMSSDDERCRRTKKTFSSDSSDDTRTNTRKKKFGASNRKANTHTRTRTSTLKNERSSSNLTHQPQGTPTPMRGGAAADDGSFVQIAQAVNYLGSFIPQIESPFDELFKHTHAPPQKH